MHSLEFPMATISRLVLLGLVANATTYAAEPVRLKSTFSADEVKWVQVAGTAAVSGTATLKLKDGTFKNCSGFNVELLPVTQYSSERIFKTYGNNEQGQVLVEDDPPKFIPDAAGYHQMLLKGVCDAKGEFSFGNVPSGDYYVMAFIIWDIMNEGRGAKAGGAVMHRIHVENGSKSRVELGTP